MELNEDIEQAVGEVNIKERRAALEGLKEKLESELNILEHELGLAFDKEKNGTRARALTMRMSYQRRALEKVKQALIETST